MFILFTERIQWTDSACVRADRSGIFYREDTENGYQGSLKSKDHGQAAKLIQAKNETIRQPNLDREPGRVYMKAADPVLTTRIWQQVIDDYCSRPHLRETSRDRPRRAFAGQQFAPIRHVALTETSTDLLLGSVEEARNASTQRYGLESNFVAVPALVSHYETKSKRNPNFDYEPIWRKFCHGLFRVT